MVTNCDLKRYFYLFDIEVVIETFALTGRIADYYYTQGDALG